MSRLFIDRVFEEAVGQRRRRGIRNSDPGRKDEMDLMSFVDFVLAWDHRNHAAALPYFFSIFDVHKQVGRLVHLAMVLHCCTVRLAVGLVRPVLPVALLCHGVVAGAAAPGLATPAFCSINVSGHCGFMIVAYACASFVYPPTTSRSHGPAAPSYPHPRLSSLPHAFSCTITDGYVAMYYRAGRHHPPRAVPLFQGDPPHVGGAGRVC